MQSAKGRVAELLICRAAGTFRKSLTGRRDFCGGASYPMALSRSRHFSIIHREHVKI